MVPTEVLRDSPWFQGRRTPQETFLVGMSALIETFGVQAPLRRPACVSKNYVRGSVKEAGNWRLFDKRYDPGSAIGPHLEFALRHEDLDLVVLKRIFEAVPPEEVTSFVRSAPYTVLPGDSLSKIAKTQLGDYRKWRQLYAANRKTLPNALLIYPGQRLVLPGASAAHQPAKAGERPAG